MRIGIPREIKCQEDRVALSPYHVELLIGDGHEVVVERDAGIKSGWLNEDYKAARARIVDTPKELYESAEFIVKVKELFPEEYDLLTPEHILLTNVHSALNRELTDALLASGATVISAEETHGPSSTNAVIAGEIGAFHGVYYAMSPHGGTGRHFARHITVGDKMEAVVLGMGQSASAAVRVLTGLGCYVTAFNRDEHRRRAFAMAHPGVNVEDIAHLEDFLPSTDLVVNCVLWDKTRTDHLITRADLAKMQKGAVIADVSCDRAGAIETSRATTWDEPTYQVDDITHFCVDNLPAAVPRASAAGYADMIVDQVRAIARFGVMEACRQDPLLLRGLTCVNGVLCFEEAGRLQERECFDAAMIVDSDLFISGKKDKTTEYCKGELRKRGFVVTKEAAE